MPKSERRISVYAVRRDPPDLELLAHAFVALAEDLRRREEGEAGKGDAPHDVAADEHEPEGGARE